MQKHSWMLWLVPAGVWGVYMCWLWGYQAGYERGNAQAWDSARSTLNAIQISTTETTTPVLTRPFE